MPDQVLVDRLLKEFVERMRGQFGSRLLYIDHHGSWARGEPRQDSDIDVMVVLDRLDDDDLDAYAAVIAAIPEFRPLASSFVCGVAELQAWPRHELSLAWHGRKVLHGSLEGLRDRPTKSDMVEEIRLKAATHLHIARYFMVHIPDLKTNVHKLQTSFKECIFALQTWMLLTTQTYYPRKADLLAVLTDPDDREVVRMAGDWDALADDRTQNPRRYTRLLERWARNMLARIQPWEVSR